MEGGKEWRSRGRKVEGMEKEKKENRKMGSNAEGEAGELKEWNGRNGGMEW